MYKSCGTSPISSRSGERGSARVKFLIIFSLVVILAFVGYHYVPVRFQAGTYKEFMQETVTKGAGMGRSSDWIKQELFKNGAEYGVPANATITIEEHEGALQARVQFKRPIELIVYTYQYEFDETVKSPSWATK